MARTSRRHGLDGESRKVPVEESMEALHEVSTAQQGERLRTTPQTESSSASFLVSGGHRKGFACRQVIAQNWRWWPIAPTTGIESFSACNGGRR